MAVRSAGILAGVPISTRQTLSRAQADVCAPARIVAIQLPMLKSRRYLSS